MQQANTGKTENGPEGMRQAGNAPTFYMLVGAPASGKSTLAAEMAAAGGGGGEGMPPEVISAAAVRRELFGSREAAHGKDREVFSEMGRRAKDALRGGRDVIYDARNLQRQRRVETLRKLRNVRCRKVCLRMMRPLDECVELNAARPRDEQVPEAALRGMHRRLDEPGMGEGWDEIIPVIPVESAMRR